MGDCTIGKELKQSTCRYVKQCKPGWSRNDKFICRKTLRRTNTNKNKNRSVNSLQLNTPRNNNPDLLKEKLKLKMFNIFGNSPNNLPKLTKKQQAALFRSPRKKKNSTYNVTQNKTLLAKKHGRRRKVAFLQNKPIQNTFNLRPT